jgi:hypothetical protein
MTDHDVLLEILAELRVLNGRRTKPLTYAEFRFLDAWIQAVKGMHGGSVWTVRQLLQSALFRGLAQNRTPKEIGDLLSRGCGQSVDGLTVERAGKEHGAVIWRILASQN